MHVRHLSLSGLSRPDQAIMVSVAALLVVALMGAVLFFWSPLAKADDLLRTDVGRRDVPVYKNGNASAGEINVRLYASQFDADGDGDTLVDSQRAVGRAYKVRGVRRIQLNTVRLQRLTDTGWETLKSAGPKNSGTASSVAEWTKPPTHFECDSSDIFRVQVIGLVRWNDNSLSSFNKVSNRWIMTDAGSSCEPLEV